VSEPLRLGVTIHDGDFEHDHLPADPTLLEPLDGLERHTLYSVGIDIGSSTSHMLMSRLVLQRRGSALSAEFEVTERTTTYRSPIWLTPYRGGGTEIDVEALQARYEDAYAEAGVWPDDVDTGAVIITGEALKKENAEAISRLIAGWSGRFICVSAGPNHEAMLAAHGSGSLALSQEIHGTVVNVDIGGGTTKVSVLVDGRVTHLESFSVGARLLAFDGDGAIVRIEEPARVLLHELGFDADLGDVLAPADRRAVAELMASVVEGVLTGSAAVEPLYPLLHVASDGGRVPPVADIDAIVFSGGVSEFLVPEPPDGLGDLGRDIAESLRGRVAAAGLAPKVRPASQGIRATVVGASQFTVQASGQTCYVSDRDALPVRDLQAVPLPADLTVEGVLTALRKHDLDAWSGRLAAVVSLTSSAVYQDVRRTAEALTQVAGAVDPGLPLHVVLRPDLARSLGTVLKEELRWAGPVIVVDGITVGELDHVDIGAPLGSSGSLPVTVTSLEFPQPAVHGRAHDHSHHLSHEH
jgi:ethanolamine utilization protein EutA